MSPKLLLCTLLSLATVFGQSFTGTISGLVTDSSGASVAGASITVTDTAKNTKYHSAANNTGLYVVSQLPPGSYRIQVEMAGFRRYILDGMPLTTQQSATVNIVLEVGQVTEKVEVTGEAQLVEAASSTLSGLIENKRILDPR